MELNKNKAFSFEDDKDPVATQDCFKATRELIDRIVEAQSIAIKNEIEANTVVINGRKYGVLNVEGLTPTICGMRAETRLDMPDEWDFILQSRAPFPKTDADRIRARTDGELNDLSDMLSRLAAWLRQEVTDG